jgi:uncharacterized Tic20 family protein
VVDEVPGMSEYKDPIEAVVTDLTGDDRTWAMLAHLSFLLTYVVGLSFIAPLIIWLVMKDRSEFVDDQAKEALNFQLAAFLVNLVAVAAFPLTCGLSLIAAVAVLIGATIYSILGGLAANRGERYRYPYTFRMIQ